MYILYIIRHGFREWRTTNRIEAEKFNDYFGGDFKITAFDQYDIEIPSIVNIYPAA